MYLKDAGFSTKSIHIRHRLPSDIKTIVTPIYQTSTFLFNSVEEGAELFAGKKEGYIYKYKKVDSQKFLLADILYTS